MCQKSLDIRKKKIDKIKEEIEEAEEDKDLEKEAIYDEDDEEAIDIEDSCSEYGDEEDWDLEDEDCNDLYDTKIDKIDEILFIRDQIALLQQQNVQQILSLIDTNCQQCLVDYIQKAEVMQQEKLAAEATKE